MRTVSSCPVTGLWIASGIFAILLGACSDQMDSVLAPSESLVVPDSTGPRILPLMAPPAGGGIFLFAPALVRVKLQQRNAAWWHSLSVVSPESKLLAGPGYLFPGPSFNLGPYNAGPVVFRLDAYNPRTPHEHRGEATQQISGAYPNWTIGFEDGGDSDFNDIIISVEAIPTGPPVVGLQVACTPAGVVRGDVVTCTAFEPSGSSLEVLGWSFLGEGGLRAEEATDANPWTGPLVVDGTVLVTAAVDGLEEMAETTVTVAARDWSGISSPFRLTEDSPGGLPEMPSRVGDLGNVVYGRPEVVTSVIREVSAGPNGGLYFLSGIPFEIELQIHVNTTALSNGSRFWQNQPRRPFTDANNIVRCARADVVPFQVVVRNHEGTNLAQGSHARRYRDKLDELAGPALEDVVAANPFGVMNLATPRFDAARQAARAEAATADDPANRPRNCLFTY